VESIIVSIYKKGDKTVCSNYRGMSLLPITYKILSNILPSRLTPYAEEIIWKYQCGLRRNRPNTDLMVCIRQMFQKKWGYMKQCIGYLQASRNLMIPLGGRSCIIFSSSFVAP
jgi:hypothetical protein